MNRFLLATLAAAVAGCTSPESTRTQGGGPGADTGNRSTIVRMHEGARPYENTPRLNPAKPPPLDGAHHAHELSRE